MGNRMSSLPMARYCAMAPRLDAETNVAGRLAAMSSAFHAKCANAPDYRSMIARLDEREQAEMSRWRAPVDCEVHGVALRVADALWECPVGITEAGRYCDRDAPEAMAHGTCDLHWRPVGGVLHVADLKLSTWAIEDGPSSLQVVGYALALAAKYEAAGEEVTHIVTGLWDVTDGRWLWSERVALDSARAGELWEAVRAAATHTGEQYSTGPHCSRCWSRLRCPAYRPRAGDEGALLALDAEKMTPAEAREALLLAQRVSEAADDAMATLKEWATRHDGIPSEDGSRVWGAVRTRGRVTVDTKALLADHPELEERYARQGAPIVRYEWRRVR